MQVSYICIERAENSICYVVWRSFSRVGRGEVVPYYWLLIQYLLLDAISIFFNFDLIKFFVWLKGWSGVSHLLNRLSSYVFFLLVNKWFQAEMTLIINSPKCQGDDT